MERAMADVQKTSQGYKSHGLSTGTFMLGQVNVALLFYWLGYSPETYWIPVMFKCYVLLFLTWKLKIQKNTQEIFYMTEFCWVFCHV